MTTVNRKESTAQVEAAETKHLHGCLDDKKSIYEKGEIVERDSRLDNDNELNNDKFLCYFLTNLIPHHNRHVYLKFSFIVHGAEN